MFNRGTALECERRARMIAPFEVARMKGHWDWINPINRKTSLTFFGVDAPEDPDDPKKMPADLPVPDAAALRKLCHDEPSIDFLILTEVHVPEEELASSGRIHVYDARAIRRKMARTE